jgi:MinD superfamily P-loop ATPase
MYIAVASGKGGTGKTLISTSLALSLGKCTYIDLDVEEPNGGIFLEPDIYKTITYTLPVPEIDPKICTFCGKCARACEYNAMAIIASLKKSLVFSELCHSCGMCAYVCPEKGAIKEIPREIGAIRKGKTGEIDFIEGRLKIGQPSGVPLINGIIHKYLCFKNVMIVDLPPGTSCPVVESLKPSDYVILVTEPTPFGLHDLKLTVEVVKEMGKDVGIIVNKDNGRRNMVDEYSEEVGIPIIYKIPYSLEIQRAYSNGIPLIELMPEKKQDFQDIVSGIMKRNEKI